MRNNRLPKSEIAYLASRAPLAERQAKGKKKAGKRPAKGGIWQELWRGGRIRLSCFGRPVGSLCPVYLGGLVGMRRAGVVRKRVLLVDFVIEIKQVGVRGYLFMAYHLFMAYPLFTEYCQWAPVSEDGRLCKESYFPVTWRPGQ